MRAQSLLREELNTPNSRAVSPSVEQVLRLLLGRLASDGHSPISTQQGAALEEIVVDTEVDGVRYLLVRLPKSAQASVQLSPREREIVRMVAQGQPNKVIADVLGISSWTVCTHLRRIFAKLGVGSRAAMVARLVEVTRTQAHTAAPSKAVLNETR
jgi:two-component system, NarL family, nitrate/nitrite response regulator NarL